MITFRVKVEGLKKNLAAGIPMVIARGLNEGGDKVRTQVQRALKTQTGVSKYSSITSRIDTLRAYASRNAGSIGANHGSGFSSSGSMSYHIIAKGKGIPIAEFPVRLTKKGIAAKTWGVDHLFKRSFGVPGQGVAGFRARLTGKRFPIRKLYGPSLPKELTTGAAREAFLASLAFVPVAVLKRLGRHLG
ncbi:hypothetical protein Msil_1544 [Methylocella silvestris BL2]|uniref:Uncharacterized protein n=2 Tax=Methylocella silvestris TaxID=199596 RepID=B8EI12_METSB|nr:hypothetical protein Msil_1544 [Methylocella silvestris BL2]